MFLQHMLAVLKPDGIVATVMPHGVLFRGGEEGKIRQRIIEDDLLDAVIGLGPNLFYGTGIPAAILILRAKGSKPPERRGKVLFINADREYTEGRAQNYLRPQHEQKIVATYRDFADVDGFAKVVTVAELAENDFNCNIRRYADNAPPPEPHDVRAHLHGGVPIAETRRCRRAARPGRRRRRQRSSPIAATATPTGTTTSRPPPDETPPGRRSARASPTRHTGAGLDKWWHESRTPGAARAPRDRQPRRTSLRPRRRLRRRTSQPEGIDRFAAAGMAATWWEDSVFDLQAAASRGWQGRARRLAHHRRSVPGRQERPRPRRPDRHPTARWRRARPTPRTRRRSRPPRRRDQGRRATGDEDDEDADDPRTRSAPRS